MWRKTICLKYWVKYIGHYGGNKRNNYGGDKMRNLIIVINCMLEVIPDTEHELIVSLKDNLSSVLYAAPEAQSFFGGKLYKKLYFRICLINLIHV